MIEPYKFANGKVYGEPDRTPVPTKTYASPIRLSLAERARLARRRKEADPEWANRSKESRRFLLELDAKEQMT